MLSFSTVFVARIAVEVLVAVVSSYVVVAAVVRRWSRYTAHVVAVVGRHHQR